MAKIQELDGERMLITLSLDELACLRACIGCSNNEPTSYYDRLLTFVWSVKLIDGLPEGVRAQIRAVQTGWNNAMLPDHVRYDGRTCRHGTPDEISYSLVRGDDEETLELECSRDEFLILWAILDCLEDEASDPSERYERCYELFHSVFDMENGSELVDEIDDLRRREFTDGSLIRFEGDD